MTMDAMKFLKTINNGNFNGDEPMMKNFAKYIEEYTKFVCDTKYAAIKNSISEMMHGDRVIKNMTEVETDKTFFVGKEAAYRHVIKVIDDVENSTIDHLAAQLKTKK
jgi:uncharacterized membrane protein